MLPVRQRSFPLSRNVIRETKIFPFVLQCYLRDKIPFSSQCYSRKDLSLSLSMLFERRLPLRYGYGEAVYSVFV